jgi:hypothetical protein
MTDLFNKAIEAIALRSVQNGGPTPADLLEAMIAGHDETIETAAVLAAKTEQAAAVLALELKRIVAHLESEAGTTQHLLIETMKKHCTENVHMSEAEFKLFIAERDRLVDEHTCGEKDEAGFRSRLVWFFASNLGKFALVAAAIALTVILNLLVYGRP